jgi:hypothetical protein
LLLVILPRAPGTAFFGYEKVSTMSCNRIEQPHKTPQIRLICRTHAFPLSGRGERGPDPYPNSALQLYFDSISRQIEAKPRCLRE